NRGQGVGTGSQREKFRHRFGRELFAQLGFFENVGDGAIVEFLLHGGFYESRELRNRHGPLSKQQAGERDECQKLHGCFFVVAGFLSFESGVAGCSSVLSAGIASGSVSNLMVVSAPNLRYRWNSASFQIIP